MGKEARFLKSVKNTDGSYSPTYGADDFNKMISCLIGSGVAPFPSKDSYSADELNAMTEAVVGSGASLDGLKVSFADKVISVAQGIAFFTNGATLEVDSEGVTLDYSPADTTYVYAAYDASLNVCDIYASDTAPEESSTYFVVNLAEISIEGVVTDKRVFARSKVATLGRNLFYSIYENTSLSSGNEYKSMSAGRGWEVPIDISLYNYIVCTVVNETSSTNNPKTASAIYGKASVESLLSGESTRITYATGTGALYAKYEGGILSVYSESSFFMYGGSEIYLC